MKKKNIIFLVLILTMIFVLNGCGASEDDGKAESSAVQDSEMSKEEKLKSLYIKSQKGSNATVDDVDLEYYGNYNGRDVFTACLGELDPDSAFYGESMGIEIGGYVFNFPNYFGYTAPIDFLAWEEDSLLTVEEAYYQGELRRVDLYRIAVMRGDVSESYNPLSTDIDWDEDWFADYVFETSFYHSYMDGLKYGYFGPYEPLSRVDFVITLVRMASEPYYDTIEPFDDVTEEDEFATEVSWAYAKGIITDTPEHLFRPHDVISREEMALMLYRYAYKGSGKTIPDALSDFSDADDISEYAKDAMNWCVTQGIISGDDGKLLPQANLTRAECAAVIYRFMENTGRW